MDRFLESKVDDDFKKARLKAMLQKIKWGEKYEAQQLLSLEQVKKYLHTVNETYIGLREIPVNKIIGSEGRYQDFNSHFLPKYRFLAERWKRVDKAYHSDITLPPIVVYQIGNYYFIRDGNHRISVAVSQGMLYIDAEVIELTTKIPLTKAMRTLDLKKQVIQFEKKQFYREFDTTTIINPNFLNFSTPGCYDKIILHILEHRYFLDENHPNQTSLTDAITSWYTTLFLPIVEVIQEFNLLKPFKNKEYGDFYLWAIDYWDGLKRKKNLSIDLKSAAIRYTKKQSLRLKQRHKKRSTLRTKSVIHPVAKPVKNLYKTIKNKIIKK